MKHLDHTNIVQYYELFCSGRFFCIVIDSGTLENFILWRTNSISEDEHFKILSQLVSVAHAKTSLFIAVWSSRISTPQKKDSWDCRNWRSKHIEQWIEEINLSLWQMPAQGFLKKVMTPFQVMFRVFDSFSFRSFQEVKFSLQENKENWVNIFYLASVNPFQLQFLFNSVFRLKSACERCRYSDLIERIHDSSSCRSFCDASGS